MPQQRTYYFSVSALMVPVYLLCRCSSCEAAVYRRSDIQGNCRPTNQRMDDVVAVQDRIRRSTFSSSRVLRVISAQFLVLICFVSSM